MLKMKPMSPMKMTPRMRVFGQPLTPEQEAGVKRYHKEKKDLKQRNVGYKPGAFYDKKGKYPDTGAQRAIGGQGGFKTRRSSGPSKGGVFGFTDKIGESHYDCRETLYEKCWKGYEKKGMKTMFGKRYPNCVKKSKKKK